MVDLLNLKHELLDPERGAIDIPQSFAACLNARGLYNTKQFVLRLSPRIHELIDAIKPGVHNSDEVDEETIQAYSTYLHETVHWWQHVGSTAGLVLSLSYPGQTHVSMQELRDTLSSVGPKKSLKTWAARQELAGTPSSNDALMQANTAVNNAIDVEFYKAFMFQPRLAEELWTHRYFESVGHGYHIAYALAHSMLATTFDPEFLHLPNAPAWEQEFLRLAADKHVGFFHRSPIYRAQVGLQALFEGQARFIQLQFLAFGSPEGLSCDALREAGYFDGIYVEAFEQFLKISESAWPDQIDHPLVGLFLLICDLAINPSRGFPIDIESFRDFITDVDPGTRFERLCYVVAHQHPELRTAIIDYSREEYAAVGETLTGATGYDHPLAVLETVTRWMTDMPLVAEVMQERESFKYKITNLPVRVLFSHFVAFSSDKLRRPEFFCWPGAWMAGSRVSEETQQLFLTHLSLFSDRGDDDGVFPRNFPDRDYEGVMQTFNTFYGTNMLYDLTRQWILQDGPFLYDYSWLSQRHQNAELAERAKSLFVKAYGINPDEFEILK
jgi:hypothetical protein